MTKETDELTAVIDAIDFTGGLAPEGVTPVTSTPEPKEPESAKEPAADSEPTPVEKPAGDKESATPDTKEPEVQKESADTDERPAIPDSHYRAMLHKDWKPEDIAEFYDANPKLALKVFAKGYEEINAVSKQLGELGQKARQLREPSAAPVVAPTTNRKAEVKALLRKEYEDSPALEALVDLIPDAKPEYRPTVDPAASQEVEIERQVAVRQQINGFFGADEMNVFGDFYGKVSQVGDWGQLTPGQRANRTEVCNRAQNILDGAAFSGMQLSSAEALEMAHLSVTAPLAEQFVRERIVKSVQKRAAGVTLKPSGSKTPAPAAGVYSKEQAVTEMGAELRKVFGT